MSKPTRWKSLVEKTLLTLVLLLGSVFVAPASGAQAGWDMLPEILARIVPPTFPDIDYPITDYGAKGDGVTDCHAAFKKAIAACTKTGGRVVAPTGTWLTNGPIHLDNNVNLHITENAAVKFGTTFDDYRPLVRSRCEGTVCMTYSPLIYAYQKTNVAVTGKGKFDGQAKDTWVQWGDKTKPGTLDNEDLREVGSRVGDAFVPVEERIFYFKPNFFEPFECENVLIEDVTILDYPFWCIHPTFCTNVTIRRLTLDSHNSNNDGINPDSSKDVLIEDCWLDQSDDCLAIKAGRDQDAWRIGKPCENIVIRNMPSNFDGIAIGSECAGGIRNVFVYDCAYDGRIIYIKSNLDRGGYVKNIFVKNLKVGSGYLLQLRNDYHGFRGGKKPTEFSNIHIEDVTLEQTGDAAVSIMGIAGAPVKDVFIKNITVKQAELPFTRIQHAENVVFENVTVNGKLQPTHPQQKLFTTGFEYITAIRDGNWSDGSIWDVWAMDGKPDGRLPSSNTDRRVMIGGGKFAPNGATVTADIDIDEIFELRIYRDSTLIIPAGTTFKVDKFRPDRTNSVVWQTGGTSIIRSLSIDDVNCKYFITGGTVQVEDFKLGEGALIIDDSEAAIKSITVSNAFRAGEGTTTTLIAHKNGIAPLQCKDLQLAELDGKNLIVDVTKYDYMTGGDLVLFSYTGTRSGKSEGGSEKVRVVGAQAELVYDDANKQVKLTNFRR